MKKRLLITFLIIFAVLSVFPDSGNFYWYRSSTGEKETANAFPNIEEDNGGGDWVVVSLEGSLEIKGIVTINGKIASNANANSKKEKIKIDKANPKIPALAIDIGPDANPEDVIKAYDDFEYGKVGKLNELLSYPLVTIPDPPPHSPPPHPHASNELPATINVGDENIFYNIDKLELKDETLSIVRDAGKTGNVVIYIQDKFKLKNSSIVTSDKEYDYVYFVYLGKHGKHGKHELKIEDNSTIYGYIISNNSKVKVKKDSEIHGGIISNSTEPVEVDDSYIDFIYAPASKDVKLKDNTRINGFVLGNKVKIDGKKKGKEKDEEGISIGNDPKIHTITIPSGEDG